MTLRTKLQVCAGLLFLTLSAMAHAVPLIQIIEDISKRTGKNFIVDPRVQGDVTLAGKDPGSITYDEFLAILQVHGYVAVESGNLVKIIPDANARTQAVPLFSGNERHPDAELVSRAIPVKTMPAAHLVPLLRPLLPQYAHLAAVRCSNSLLMVDTFANVRRIEALVRSVDTGKPYSVDQCAAAEAPPQRAD